MIYFDNGATTYPKPQSVIRAVSGSMRFSGANPGRGGHRMALKASELVYNCRKTAAAFFGAGSPENIIFTESCTTALNTVIHGLLREGGHAVISSLEHNAVARPLAHLKRYGVSFSVARAVEGDNGKTIDNFRQAIRSDTKLVVCTAASNVFGIRLPVERIAALCRIYGIPFCVDAAQTAGVVPVDIGKSGIDFLCAAGHKGLYGPMGTGILAINSGTLPESLTQGGTGSLSASLTQPGTLPDKYESGTPNLPGIAGLAAGIKFVTETGQERIMRTELSNAKRLYEGLARIPGVILYTKSPKPGGYVPVISFNLKNRDSEEVASLLDSRYNIAVRAGLHCAPLAHRSFGTVESGTVRAVMSVYTKAAQVDYFVSAVRAISKAQG